jgi:predicted PurR-regulated permease PerM
VSTHTRGSTEANGHRARLFIIGLAAAVLIAISPYIPGLLGACVLYVICRPPYKRLAKAIGGTAAALLLVTAAAVLLVLPAAWLTIVLVEQAPAALRGILTSDAFARLAAISSGPVDIGAQMTRAGEGIIAWVSREAVSRVGDITRGMLNLLLSLVGLYYLLHSPHAIWARLRPMIPFSPARADVLRTRFYDVTEATVLGILATALAQSITVGLGFWAVGLPNPVVWALVTAFASVLPVLGSALVWGPGVLVLLASGRYFAAGGLAFIGLVIASNIDNVIRPIIYRRRADVHPLVTLVGAFAGVERIGLVGLLLGPLAISYVFELVRLYEEEYGLPGLEGDRDPNAGLAEA